MVLKILDICPNGEASIKGMDGYLISIQLSTQGTGEKTDGVDKKDPGPSFREKGGIGDQSRVEKLLGGEGPSQDINAAAKRLVKKKWNKMKGAAQTESILGRRCQYEAQHGGDQHCRYSDKPT